MPQRPENQLVKSNFLLSSSMVRYFPSFRFFRARMSAFLCVAVGMNSLIFFSPKRASYSLRGMTTKSSFLANFLGIVSVFICHYDNKNYRTKQHAYLKNLKVFGERSLILY